jgi:hypothetical protein
MIFRVTVLLGGLALAAGCVEPPPPRSVQEFLDSPLVLEAALVRCSRNRPETRYEAECVNAREANNIIAAREEAERRAEFEAQSERKRQALRRAQEAAAEARRRAAEAERRREEAAYLAQFGQLPPDSSEQAQQPESGNVPIAVLPEPAEDAAASDDGDWEPLGVTPSILSNAPEAQVEPEPEPETEVPRNLDEIRQELKRRDGE